MDFCRRSDDSLNQKAIGFFTWCSSRKTQKDWKAKRLLEICAAWDLRRRYVWSPVRKPSSQIERERAKSSGPVLARLMGEYIDFPRCNLMGYLATSSNIEGSRGICLQHNIPPGIFLAHSAHISLALKAILMQKKNISQNVCREHRSHAPRHLHPLHTAYIRSRCCRRSVFCDACSS